jgi:hypothetical protein
VLSLACELLKALRFRALRMMGAVWRPVEPSSEGGREREREKSTETDESFEMVFGRQAVDLERERVITEERWSDLGGCFDEESQRLSRG